MTRSALAGLLAGCQPGPGDSSYKAGELGNGGFVFECDDTLASARWSNDAKSFPSAVALGSTFRLRFVPRDANDPNLVGSSNPNDATSLSTVGPFVSRGPDGFAAIKAGYATLAVKNAQGVLVDFTRLRVAKPDGFAVFDATGGIDTATANGAAVVTSITMKLGERRKYRTIAREKLEDLAGGIRYEWTSPSDATVHVESYAKGVVTILATGVGKSELAVAGGGMVTQKIPVEVTP